MNFGKGSKKSKDLEIDYSLLVDHPEQESAASPENLSRKKGDRVNVRGDNLKSLAFLSMPLVGDVSEQDYQRMRDQEFKHLYTVAHPMRQLDAFEFSKILETSEVPYSLLRDDNKDDRNPSATPSSLEANNLKPPSKEALK